MTTPIASSGTSHIRHRPDDSPQDDTNACHTNAGRSTERAAEKAQSVAASYADSARSTAASAETTTAVRSPTVLGAGAAAVVHPERSFSQIEPLATEVMRLRAALAKATDSELRSALVARVATLSNQWCQMASAAGMKPPPASLDPMRCSDKELKNAILWTQVGNSFPLGSFAHPVHPDKFLDELMTAWTLRTPGMLDRLVAARPNDPRLIPLLQMDLARRGEKQCNSSDTVESLLRRRADLIAKENAAAYAEDSKRSYIGLDGRIGTPDALGNYEAEQFLLAMNPGTTFGGLLAAFASGGADASENVEQMRRAGQAGNLMQSFAQAGGIIATPGSKSGTPTPGHDSVKPDPMRAGRSAQEITPAIPMKPGTSAAAGARSSSI